MGDEADLLITLPAHGAGGVIIITFGLHAVPLADGPAFGQCPSAVFTIGHAGLRRAFYTRYRNELNKDVHQFLTVGGHIFFDLSGVLIGSGNHGNEPSFNDVGATELPLR